MRTIQEILAEKGHRVWTVDAKSSVFDALKEMSERGIGALLVTEGEQPAGMISERDYARKVILFDRSSRDTRVEEIMTKIVAYVRPAQTVEEAMAIMTEKRIRHLPVMDDGKVTGMVSIGDCVKVIIAEQQFTIEQLAHYISG